MAEATVSPRIIKVSFNEDTRKISDVSNYENLIRSVWELFSLQQNEYYLKYIDDEEDLITISSDEDLEIALDLFRNTCPKIRVYLKNVSMSNFSIISINDASNSKMIQDIQVDECESYDELNEEISIEEQPLSSDQYNNIQLNYSSELNKVVDDVAISELYQKIENKIQPSDEKNKPIENIKR